MKLIQVKMEHLKKLSAFFWLLSSLLSVNCESFQNDNNFAGVEDYVYSQIDSIVQVIGEPQSIGDTIDFMEFAGIKPDMQGTHDFQPAFKKVIEKIDSMGGGILYFKHTKGKQEWIKETDVYRFSGPIELTSNLTILMDPSIKLKFDFNLEAYKNDGQGVITRYEGTTIYGLSPCIRAFNKENIVFKWERGYGAMPVIQGDGEKWQKWMIHLDLKDVHNEIIPGYKLLRIRNNEKVPLRDRKYVDLVLRPDLVQFFLCKNIVMDGVFLKESPFWVVHSIFSENLIFRNLCYDAQVVNNDGIDVESSKNVLIENIVFNNHDDNVVIKSGRDQEGMFGVDIRGTELEEIESDYIKGGKLGGMTENVAVRNCTFQGHHAVCVGSEMSGGAKNIYVADCFSPQYVFMALYLKGSRKRGGEVSEVYMINCKFGEVRDDLVGLVPNYDGDTISQYPSCFHDVYVKNVEANTVQGYGIRTVGWPDQFIENVFIENVKINQVHKEPIKIKQSKNIQLKNVEIQQEMYHQKFNHQDEHFKPEKQL